MQDIHGYFHHIITRPPRHGRQRAIEAFENYLKENEKMNKKLVIDEDLDQRIKNKKDNIPGDENHNFYQMVGQTTGEIMKRNNLTIEDFPRLFRGDYIVRKDYEVGQYYFSLDAIFKVSALDDDTVKGAVFYTNLNCNHYSENDTFQYRSPRDRESRLATKNEIKLFNRAEQFYKQGRELNEFKDGDVVRTLVSHGICNPVYYKEGSVSKNLLDTLTLVCTKEMRGDL